MTDVEKLQLAKSDLERMLSIAELIGNERLTNAREKLELELKGSNPSFSDFFTGEIPDILFWYKK